MSDSVPPTIRERSRRATHAELMAVAQDLFLGHGFDQVTMDQIAEAAGVSKRTLFRYFTSKEDILVGGYDKYGERLVAALAQRPTTEPVWESLRCVFNLMVSQERATQDRSRAIALEKIVHDTPQLSGRFLDKMQNQQSILVEPVRARLGTAESADDPLPAAIVGAAFACLYAARAAWLASGQAHHISEYLDRAMSGVALPHDL